MTTRKDLPSEKSANFSQRLRETLQTYLGRQGNPLDRGVTLRDMVEGGWAKFNGFAGDRAKLDFGDALIGLAGDKDLTPPPMPTGVEVVAAITNLIISTDDPVYKAGGGHASMVVYGQTYTSGAALPLFSTAVKLTEIPGAIGTYATTPATTWHIWVTWKSLAGVEGPPAGGTNGFVARTGEDVALLLNALAGEITEGQLYQDLNARINLIDGAVDLNGSVSARIAAQALAQANALSAESDARILAINTEIEQRNAAIGTEVLNRSNALAEEARLRVDAVAQEARARLDLAQESGEAMLRNVLSINATALAAADTVAIAKREIYTDVQDGLSAEATERLTLAAKLDTDIATTLAVVAEESSARVDADSAEAAQRALLATQILGPDGTSLTQGLIFNERYTRSQANLAIAQQITLLSAGAGEQFDWAEIWYFDAGPEGWTGNGAPSVHLGWVRPANSNAPTLTSPSGLGLDGAKYTQIRLRVRKHGAPVWKGLVSWSGGSTTVAEPTYDANGAGLVTVNPTWGGTVGSLAVELYEDQTDTDWHEVDWVAVGRPSPGASSAQILELERVTVDPTNSTSLASKLTVLDSAVNGPTGLTQSVSTIANEYVTQADINSTSATAQQTLLSQFGATSKTRVSATRPGFVGGVQTNPDVAVTLADGSVVQQKTYRDGDLWIDSANSNALYAWATNAWVPATDATVLGTAAFINAWENTYANGDGAGATALRALNAAYANGGIATSSDISDVQEVLSDAIGSVARDTRILKSQSAELDGALLTSILNAEATKAEFKGELAIAREDLQTNIVVGLSAEASKRLELAAVVNTNAAAFTLEQVATATRDEAISQSVETLTATVDGNQAALVNNYYTKANADLATVQSQKTLVANFGASTVFRDAEPPTQGTVNVVLSNGDTAQRVKIRVGDLWFDTNDGNKPHIWSGAEWVYTPDTSLAASQAYLNDLENALATADTATVTAWRNLVASVLDPVTGLNATRSDLNVQQSVQAERDRASATETRTLKSQSAEMADTQLKALLNAEAARVEFKGELAIAREDLQTNIVVGLSAEASKRLVLATAVDANAAALVREQIARTTRDEAIAQDVLNLNAVVDGNQALLRQDYYTKATADQAISSANTALVATLTAPSGAVGSLRAELENDYYTKVDVDGAISTQRTNLRAYAATSSSRTFRQATEPARRGYDELGVSIPLQVGDVWFDTDDSNRAFVCTVASASEYAWAATDSTFAQATAPLNPVHGAIWIDTSNDNIPNVWNGLSWVAYRDVALTRATAAINTIETTKIGYATTAAGLAFDNNGAITGKAGVDAWNAANPSNLLTWNVGLPLAKAVKQVSVTDANGNVAAMEQAFTAQKTLNDKFKLQYSIKLDNNGYMSGFGLYSDEVGSSEFIVNANRFAVTSPESSIPVWVANTYYAVGAVARVPGQSAYTLVCKQDGTTGSVTPSGLVIGDLISDGGVKWQVASRVPFAVQAIPTNINGVAVPAGVYIDAAYILNATIKGAQIGKLAVDDTHIVELNVGKLTAGEIKVGQYIQSQAFATYGGVSQPTWKIDGAGNATFNNATVRGTVYATNGSFTGTVYATDGQFYGTLLGGSASGYGSGTGLFSGESGGYKWRVGNPSGARIQWTGSGVEIYNASGALTLSSGGVDWANVTGTSGVETVAGATAKANAAQSAAIAAATIDAAAKASAAQNAAQIYAEAQAAAVDVSAKAYADGIVDAEEARAIADAQAKAEAARSAAVSAAAADATAKANVAATTATWTGVSGTGKPQDNATVGADSSNLKVGLGINLLLNSDLILGSTNWSLSWNQSGVQDISVGRDHGGDDWRPTGLHNFGISRSGTPTGVWDAVNTAAIAVTPGTRYEASAFIACHRCSADVALLFYDANGNQVGEHHSTATTASGGRALSGWAKLAVFANAPATAHYVNFFVRSYANGGNNPFTWVVQPFVGVAGAAQTEPSQWSASNFAEQITASNVGTYIADAGIGSAQIANASITSAKIGDAAITNAKIADAVITSAKIGYAEINTLNVAGEAITKGESAFTAGSVNGNNGWITVQSINFTSSGSRVFICASGQGSSTTYMGNDQSGSEMYATNVTRLVIDGNARVSGRVPCAINYSEFLSAGSHTIELQFLGYLGSFTAGSISDRSLFALETKR